MTMTTSDKQTTSAIALVQYINDLPYLKCIFPIEAHNANYTEGNAVINKDGDYAFEVSAKLGLKLWEQGNNIDKPYNYDFSYHKQQISLLAITDRNGQAVAFSNLDRIPLESALSHKLIFDIIKKF